MKRIILILAILAPLTLFSQAKLRKGYIATENGDTISCLYQNGQWVLESDTTFIVLVDTIKFFDGTTLATASGIGSSIGGAGGLSRVGDNIELGGTPLNKNVVIPGTGYGVEIGTDASNVGPIQIKSNDELSITTSGSQFFNAIGIEWELLGNHWINNNTGDTLQTGTDVYNKIEQSSLDSLDLPFLPTNYKYDYSTITTDSRPGPGLFRFNNTAHPSVTEIYIDNFDINLIDQSNYISLPDTGSYIFISDGTNYVNYKITGEVITASSYYKYEVTYLSNSGVITGSCELSVDLSNDVGGSGGLSDKLVNATDTITLVNDTLSMTDQVLDAQTVVTDSLNLLHNETKIGSIYANDLDGIVIEPISNYDLLLNSPRDIGVVAVQDVAITGTGTVSIDSDNDIDITTQNDEISFTSQGKTLLYGNGGLSANNRLIISAPTTKLTLKTSSGSNESYIDSSGYYMVNGGNEIDLFSSSDFATLKRTLGSSYSEIQLYHPFTSITTFESAYESVLNIESTFGVLNHQVDADNKSSVRVGSGTDQEVLLSVENNDDINQIELEDTYTSFTYNASEYARIDTSGINVDTAEVWAIKWKDGTGYVSGNDTSNKFIEDTVETKVLIVGEGAVKDTAVGFIDPAEDIPTLLLDSVTIKGYAIRFNESEGVHEFITAKSGVVWQGALEDLIQFYNSSGVTIPNGRPVAFAGSVTGDSIPDGILATNLSEDLSDAFIAISTIEVPNGDWGYATTRGMVRGVPADYDTAELWLGDEILVDSVPPYPARKVFAGIVIKSDPVDGIIFASPSQAYRRPLVGKSYNFTSQGIGAGTYYRAGYYDYPTADANLTQALTTITYGTANIAYSAHPFIVFGGASVDAGTVGLRVTGASIDDNGVRVASDADTITTDITSLTLNNYYEAKKFLGTVTYELFVSSGTPTTYSLDFNYGYAKYEDAGNRDFYVTGMEVVGLAAAADVNFNIKLLHHKTDGWTYAATGFVAGNGSIAEWSTDMTPDDNLGNGLEFAWKRTNLTTFINGAGSEGVIIEITTGVNNSVQSMDLHFAAQIEE